MLEEIRDYEENLVYTVDKLSLERVREVRHGSIANLGAEFGVKKDI